MDFPEEFWCVKCGGTSHRVPEREADKVRQAIEDAELDTGMHPDLFLITDIYGCSIYIDLKSVGGIWESTPDLREREGRHQKLLEKEYEGEF